MGRICQDARIFGDGDREEPASGRTLSLGGARYDAAMLRPITHRFPRPRLISLRRGFTLGALMAALAAPQARAQPRMDAFYRLGPDSLEQEGVPRGRFLGPRVLPSKVFPGTQHTYDVYVPAQYDPKRPAALTIFQDGPAMMAPKGDIRAQNVIDNLTWRREIPVMLAVFISPGRRPDQPEPTANNWGDKDTNRPEEYNRPNDKYARVLVEELLPALAAEFNLSKDPTQRCLVGASSGGIAAFNAAWERPDQFRKVISIVGSFVDLRGGHTFPEKVLKSARKPLRVFIQDGRNDHRAFEGGQHKPERDWFLQNKRLVDALTRKGYDLAYSFGVGNHGQKQGGAILPEMMRWIWRDQPVSTDPRDLTERSFAGAGGEASQGGPSPEVLAAAKWSTVKPEGAPHARHESALTAVGGKLILLGGRGLKPVDIYDPATNTWSEGAPPPQQIHHFQAVAVGGLVYVVGALMGGYPAEPAVGDVLIYDVAKNEWRRGPSIPEARRRGAAGAVFRDGTIYVLGGLTEGHNGGFVPWFDALDVERGTWKQLPDAPRPRDHFQAALVGNKLIAAGGRRSSAKTKETFTLTIPEVDVYDLGTRTWSTLPGPGSHLPTPRAGTTTVAIGDHVLVIGGESGGPATAHAEVQALHVPSGVFRTLSPLVRGRHGTQAVVVGDRVWIAAGSGNRGGGPELDSLEVLAF